MPTFINKARGAAKKLAEYLTREPSSGETKAVFYLTCGCFIWSLLRFLVGGDDLRWVGGVVLGGASLLMWLGFVLHRRHRILSVLLRLASVTTLLLAIGFVVVLAIARSV